MSLHIRPPTSIEEIYPTSDGQPMAENTLQFEWITTIKGGLDAMLSGDSNVFVAGDVLWYPVEGDPTTRIAPDAMVAFGRPKGYRGSYLQWRENAIAPQVVFEVLSPVNRAGEMVRKFDFYQRFGVEEYYVYDPDTFELTGWRRDGDRLVPIPETNGWVSPRLGIRFETGERDLKIFGRDGRPFATYIELARQRNEMAQQRDEAARQLKEERQRAERLVAKLRELGLEPET